MQKKVKVMITSEHVHIQIPKEDYFDIKIALKHSANQFNIDLLKKLEKEEKCI